MRGCSTETMAGIFMLGSILAAAPTGGMNRLVLH
jgi:hypothetical protein